MRNVAALVGGISLAGCSLIYNPANLPVPIDAPPADADPSMLRLDGAGPAILLEGQGAGGSRPAILAITGANFISAATVRVYATGSETPMITVNNSDPMIMPRVDSTSTVLVVSVTLPVDTTLPSSATSSMQDIPLTIEVSQPLGAGVITKTLTGAVTLRTLPELTTSTVNATLGSASAADSMKLAPMYSQVDVPGGLTFAPAAGKPPALIRSTSTINLGNVTVSTASDGSAAGPGGADGGAAGQAGGGGTSGGLGSGAGGGGGGFAAMGGDGGNGNGGKGGDSNGDPSISSYATNISAGGGGGSVAGGSGGGALELTAAGGVHVGAIAANGGVGGNGGLGAGGGGGAGGIVVIRSGATASLGGAISVAGGAGGGGTLGKGGGGSIGRTRVDAPVISGAQATDPPPMTNPRYHIGASFDPATPFIFTEQTQKSGIKLLGSVADKFEVAVLDSTGAPIPPKVPVDFGNATTIFVKPALQPGFNRVCVTVSGVSVAIVEATNCIDIAYLP